MSLPISSCLLMSFLFSKISLSFFTKKKAEFNLNLSKRAEFYKKKKSLLEDIYSLTTDHFSQKEAETAFDGIKIFEKRLKVVRDLDKFTNELNKVLSRLGYLDLEFKENLEKRTPHFMDHLNLEVKKDHSESLYQLLYNASAKHLKESLKYLEEPLKMIATPISISILGGNKVHLPRSTLLFFKNTLRGVFPKQLKKLQKGGFSEVFSVNFMRSSFACKKYTKSRDTLHQRVKESCACMLLKHRNIAAIEAISPEGLYLELANGDLLELLNKRFPSPQELKQVFQEIADALLRLHSANLTYKDLKLDNVLFLETSHGIKSLLCDFGLIAPTKDDRLKNGTPEYAAPELWHGREPYSQKVDSWAFGVLMCYLIINKHPFVESCDSSIVAFTLSGRIGKPCKEEYLINKLDEVMKNHEFVSYARKTYTKHQLDDAASNTFRKFLSLAAGCLDGNPARRFSMDQILERLKVITC